MNLDKWFRRRSSLIKDISYLKLWSPCCLAEWSHLYNFGKGQYKEQFCEIILNLDQWFRARWRLKVFLIWSSGGPFLLCIRTICAILIEDIIRNNSVKLIWNWTSGSEGDFVQKISSKELWQPLSSASITIYAISVEGIMGNIHVKLFLIWTNGAGDVF